MPRLTRVLLRCLHPFPFAVAGGPQELTEMLGMCPGNELLNEDDVLGVAYWLQARAAHDTLIRRPKP